MIQSWPRCGIQVPRRAAVVIASLILAGCCALGLLFLMTPSVSDATARAHLQIVPRGVAYAIGSPPSRFAEALIATEDQRFYSPFDPGIDPIAIVRVILGQLAGLGDQGGSTIEQQLAKMLYTPGRVGLLVKFERMILAIKLNFSYTKDQILSMYEAVAYFGDGHYGLEAASCGYFGRRPEDLSWTQAATLAGLVKAPTADNPRINPYAAQKREAHVLTRLVTIGVLTEMQAEAARSRPLDLVPLHSHRLSPPFSTCHSR